jgi:hypothetical protein
MRRCLVSVTGPLLLAAVPALFWFAGAPRPAAAREGPMWVGRHPVVWTPARAAAASLVPASVRVARDPESGALVAPDAAQSRALAATPRRELEPLQVVVLSDGSLMIDLKERFMWDFAVVRGPDGRLRVACSDDARALDHAAEARLAAPLE